MKQDYDVRVLRSHGIDRRWVISVISVSSTVTNVGGADDGRSMVISLHFIDMSTTLGILAASRVRVGTYRMLSTSFSCGKRH